MRKIFTQTKMIIRQVMDMQVPSYAIGNKQL